MIWAICGETKEGKQYLIKQVLGGSKESAEKHIEKLTDYEKKDYVKFFVEESTEF